MTARANDPRFPAYGETTSEFLIEMLAGLVRNASIAIQFVEDRDLTGAAYAFRRLSAHGKAARGALKLLQDAVPGDRVPDTPSEPMRVAA